MQSDNKKRWKDLRCERPTKPNQHPHHSSISPPINHLLLAQPSGLLPSHPPRNSARFRLPCKYIVISILDCRHALVSKSRLQSQGPCPCLSHRPSNLRHPSAHPHLPTCKCEPIDCVCLFFSSEHADGKFQKKKKKMQDYLNRHTDALCIASPVSIFQRLPPSVPSLTCSVHAYMQVIASVLARHADYPARNYA